MYCLSGHLLSHSTLNKFQTFKQNLLDNPTKKPKELTLKSLNFLRQKNSKAFNKKVQIEKKKLQRLDQK